MNMWTHWTQKILALALLCGALPLTAQARPSMDLNEQRQTRQAISPYELEAVVDLSAYSDEEYLAVMEALADFNSLYLPGNQVASSSEEMEMISKAYLCVGGKLAAVVYGYQIIRCVDSELNGYDVVLSLSDADPFTGLIVDEYFGITAGFNAFVGVMIHQCPPALCQIDESILYPTKPMRGGTVGLAYSFLGGLVGHYRSEQNYLTIFGWKGGISAEAAISNIHIRRAF